MQATNLFITFLLDLHVKRWTSANLALSVPIVSRLLLLGIMLPFTIIVPPSADSFRQNQESSPDYRLRYAQYIRSQSTP